MSQMDKTLILTCEMCTHKYTHYKKLKKHYKRKHPEKDVLQCPLCTYVTINRMDIKQHRKIQHPGNKFVCHQCGFSSKRWSKWKEHLEVGHQREVDPVRKGSELSVREINPDITLSNCTDRKDIEVADMVSDPLSHKPVSCTECYRQFDSYERLKKHYKKRHGDLEIQQCPFCQFVTPTAKALAEHKRLSHREVIIFCLDCDFSTKKWLKWYSHLSGTKHKMKQSGVQTLSSPVPKLQCLNCDYASHSYKRLKKHYHIHHKEQVVFECPFCDYVTVESPEIKHHKKTSHSQEQMCCSLCDFTTRKLTKWICHQENEHLVRINGSVSKVCFFTKSTEKCDQQIDRYIDESSTKLTSNNFESSLSFVAVTPETCSDRKHNGEKETVHSSMTEIKDVAKSTELRNSQMITHRNVGSGSAGLSVCGTGGRDLTVTQQLAGCDVVCPSVESVGKFNREQPVDSEIHKVEGRLSVGNGMAGSSDNVKLFVCKTCQKSFKTRSHLKRHAMTVHSSVRNYTCSECSKTFKTSGDLRRHRLIYSDVRNYICGECDKIYKTQWKLQRHELIHTGQKCFKCTQCDFATNYERVLEDHMNCHMGIKPYTNLIKPYLCKFCGKSFRSRIQLRDHMRTHTEERPYKCEYCDFAAARYYSYTEHMRIHLNIKPYKCTECDYSSSQSTNLKGHVMTHTGEKPFTCPVCGRRFSRKYNMKKHTIKIHFKDS